MQVPTTIPFVLDAASLRARLHIAVTRAPIDGVPWRELEHA